MTDKETVEVRQIDVEDPQAGEVQVEIRACGFAPGIVTFIGE